MSSYPFRRRTAAPPAARSPAPASDRAIRRDWRNLTTRRRGGGNNSNNNARSALPPPTSTAVVATGNQEAFDSQTAALIPAEVRMISGCHSEQTSADVSNVGAVTSQLPNPSGRSGGAATSALLDILYNKSNQTTTTTDNNNNTTDPKAGLTFQNLLLELREQLAQRGFDQIPQLTSSRPLDCQETPFQLVQGDDGTARALLCGINYHGQSGALSGCINDVFNMKRYLMEQHGFQEHNILVLVDDGEHQYPTRQAIINSLKQLVVQSVSGDSVFFHYSGHGGLLNPEWNAFKMSSKEYDETLFPLDHERSGQIRDFSLFNNFVKPMPAGVLVTCVMDCCHSGAVLELPYMFRPTAAGTIRMRQSMDSLSNLAFLYLLAGGMLPTGFDNVASNIETTTGGTIEDYQGMGTDETVQDGMGNGYWENVDDTGGDAAAAAAADDYGGGDGGDFDGAAGDYGGDVGGFDDTTAGGTWNGGDAGASMFDGADAGDAPEMDCGCIADVIGGLLDD